jgi:hypothetical protein
MGEGLAEADNFNNAPERELSQLAAGGGKTECLIPHRVSSG